MRFSRRRLTWAEIEAWRPWFAWYPVRIGHEFVFLEWVERRVPWCHGPGDLEGPLFPEYRHLT